MDWRRTAIRAPVAGMENELLDLLREREEVIADHDWRDRDPADHLDALRRVSEGIAAWAGEHAGEVDPRLRHFLENASYAKAKAELEARMGG